LLHIECSLQDLVLRWSSVTLTEAS
jgi:hypothetical protein